MVKYCSQCTYLKTNDPDLYGCYWCEKKLERVLATQAACSRFCEAYSRSSREANSFYDYSKEHSSSGSSCYLTTIVCRILKFNDDNEYLNELRQFRKIMQQNDEYIPILVEYDIVGPKIANAIDNDPQRDLVAQSAFENYIKPVVYMLRKKDYNNAVNRYIELTNKLRVLYNISEQVTNEQINNTNVNESGHGVYKVKGLS